MTPRGQREFSRFIKFSVVGAIGAVVDFGTFNLLNVQLGVYSVLASIFSFSAAILSNFIWNRYWTYPDSRSKSLARQATQFAFVSVVGLAIRTPIFAFMELPMTRFAVWAKSVLPASLPSALQLISGFEEEILGRNFALALAIIVVLFWNFGINRIWTYSDIS